MKKFVRISVKGKVQGVFFRQSTKEKADELGIKGIVRNMPDSSVYIEAVSADDNILNEFILFCHEGPPLSRVSNVDAEYVTGLASDYAGFEVKE